MSDAKSRSRGSSDPAAPAVADSAAYRVLARKYRPCDLRRSHRPGRDGAHRFERVRNRTHSAGLDPHRRARRRQDHDRAHSRARAQLPIAGRIDPGADRCDAGAWRELPGDHGEPAYRRPGNGRRLAQRRRRCAPDQRCGALRAGECALQGLHPRRSAHAVAGRVQRTAEDAGRAAAAREIHFRDHRDPQSADHGAVALPALRPAPRRGGIAGRASRQDCRQGKYLRRTGSLGADRARRRRLGARFAFIVRSGDRACRRPR